MGNLTEKQAEYLPYFVMLDLMQESGQMNMFGAPAKLREIHPGLGRRQAVDVVSEWMKTKTVASDEQIVPQAIFALDQRSVGRGFFIISSIVLLSGKVKKFLKINLTIG